MINKALALLLIFSLAFNIAFVGIWAYHRSHLGPRPQRGPVQPVPPRAEEPWRQLGLSAEQARKVGERWRKAAQQIEAAEATVRQQRARLFQLLQANELDEAAIHETMRQMEEAQQKVRGLAFDQIYSVRQMLTPEQRRRWIEMMLRFSEGRGAGRGPGPRRAFQPAQGQGPRGRAPEQRQPMMPPPGEPQP